MKRLQTNESPNPREEEEKSNKVRNLKEARAFGLLKRRKKK